MATIIEMPKLSDTMSVGTVVKWHKQRGTRFPKETFLAEIETDKATMELENFENGVLLKVFVEEGVEVAIGSALAAVGEEGEVIEDIEAPDPAVEVQAPAVRLKKSRPVKAKAASRRRKRNLLSYCASAEEHEPTNVDGEEERKSGGEAEGAKRGIVRENFGFAARQEDRS